MLRRLPHSPLPVDGGEVVLSEDATRHARVLRLSAGDRIRLFDGAGHEADAEVVGIDGEQMLCRCEARVECERFGPTIVLCAAPPKGTLDDLVRGATELGVSAIQLVETERSVVKMAGDRARKKVQRLQRIAEQAARQSLRSHTPEVREPSKLAELAGQIPEGALKLVCTPEGGSRAVDLPATSDEIWVVIGPEGGFSEREVQFLENTGFSRLHLSDGVLRVATAALTAVALLRAR